MAGALRAPGGGQPPHALRLAKAWRALAACAVAALALGACVDPYTGRSYYAALDSGGGVATTGEPIAYRVQAGDTLFRVAEKFSVSARQIVKRNDLEPPYHLEKGQRLAVPRPVAHVVIPKDTVFSIAQRYGIEQDRLMALNGLESPDSLQVGQRLKLPWSEGSTQVASTGSEPAGDSAAARADRAPEGTTANAPEAPVPADRPDSDPGASASGTPEAAGDGAAADAEATGGAAAQRPDPDRRFLRPVAGEVIVDFGPQGDDRHNDGINIAAEAGTPVRAAAAGQVAYAGRDLEAFGKLVLVRHTGEWVTAYAHLGAIGVDRGNQLDRGDRLGTVGATGKAQRPQLHFELRRGTQAVDPMPYLESPDGPALAAR